MSTLSVPLTPRRPSGSVSSSAQVTPWPGTRGLRVRWSRVITLSALLLAAMAVGALITGLVGTGGGAASAGAPRGDGATIVASPTALVVHTVAPGDTLWAIASAVDPAADPRPMVDRIMRLNNLTTGEVAVGTQLLVPARP